MFDDSRGDRREWAFAWLGIVVCVEVKMKEKMSWAEKTYTAKGRVQKCLGRQESRSRPSAYRCK